MFELKEGMTVLTPGGEELGRINRFVLDPATNEVTHVVVQKGWLLPEDKVLPFEMVRSTDDEKLVLSEEVPDFDQLPSFEETHFVSAADERPPGSDVGPGGDPAYAYTPAYYWYPSHSNVGYPGIGFGHFAWPVGETKRNIPEDTVPIQEGTDIRSADGKHVGDVERLLIDPESNKVTHFVASQGVLFKDRKLIPIHWVKQVDEENVFLVVNSQLLERLPPYEE